MRTRARAAAMIARRPAVLLLVLTLGCVRSPTDPTPLPSNAVTDADLAYCVSETNRYRTDNGVAEVARSATIESHAAVAARADAESGVAHSYSRANATGAWAENEVLRQSFSVLGGTPRSVVRQAMELFWRSEGPDGGHRQNLVGPYTQVGCGFFVSGGLVTFVQHFRR